jgi:hypothetical protein
MVQADRALGMVLVAAIATALAGCERKPADAQKDTIVSGPVGLEYSVHPTFREDGRETIAGCCSFNVADAQVLKLEGDVDGRDVTGRNYRAVFNFGGRFVTNARQEGTSLTTIDGVQLYKVVDPNTRSTEPRIRVWATIPLSAEGDRNRVAPPKFEASGWCEEPDGCQRLERLFQSLRF